MHSVFTVWGFGAQAIPRLTSQGSMCGAVYRVASERQIPIF